MIQQQYAKWLPRGVLVFKIGVVGLQHTPTGLDEAGAIQFLERVIDEVVQEHPSGEYIIVSTLDDQGAAALAYAIASKRGWLTEGIVEKHTILYRAYEVDEEITVGKGGPSLAQAFLEECGVLISVGDNYRLRDAVELFHTEGKPLYEFSLDDLMRR